MRETRCGGRCGDSRKRREVGLIMKANRLHRNAVEKNLKSLCMQRSQRMLLMLVSYSNGEISQREIADKLQITPAAVAMTLKKMESNGYIARETDKYDSRINRIVLLPKGEEAVRLSEKVFVAIDEAMFQGITETELKAFTVTMEKINNNLIAFEKMAIDTLGSEGSTYN